MQFYLILWCLLFLSTPIMAQQDSTILTDHSDTIILEKSRLPDFGLGHNTKHLGKEVLSTYSSRNLAQVLQLESTFFVKNYGPSGISSLSGRGGGASHTAVLWEGFNIQSPMLGQADISLLPAVFVDYVDIQYGGESALFGNSSIGGALHLGTNSKFGRGWHFEGNLHGGSFEDIGQQFNLSYSNHWYSGSIRSFYHNAKNNYLFKDINAFGFPKPIKEQTNARLQQWGILQEHNVKFKKHQLGIKAWYQDSKRQIPPPLLLSSSNDFQKDEALRLVAHWKTYFDTQVWKARSALFLESLHFQSDAVNSLSKILSSISEIENKWYLNNLHHFNFGLNYSFFKASSGGYTQDPQQHRLALFGAYKFTSAQKKWAGTFSIREELVNNNLITPAASLGGTWNFYKKFRLNLHLSHNYRLPTFNDLYWNTLGNSNLKPEYSWNSELGLCLPFWFKQFHIETTITGFCNLVNDWILWSPNTAGLWRPSNVEQVWARGMELNVQGKFHWKQWQFKAAANYAFTQSTRTKGSEQSTIGKQLIYTPAHNANIRLQVQYRQTSLLYQHSVTSLRYIDNANTEILPLFHVGYLRLNQRFSFKNTSANLYLQINNLFGEDYQVVSNRAMPWQQFELGIGVRL
ncbi:MULTISPECIES: TonB-dependent siderophore receptor [unclassified Aureispira]|uniref:TonB-dependent receptor plug domain-containing protein n=1 Tax=unclassified Aureispira TaxID=2649989 RepID=UPI00069609EA|nr:MULTISPECIES: TonB-dependent receptor plug domain-containing protein [unclassified Aureispira]WMX13503.1 TonB-dependent receptor plug domain-containing protein [Aureispira sp. CCB-E]